MILQPRRTGHNTALPSSLQWLVVTSLGVSVGWAAGWMILDALRSSSIIEFVFWAIPAACAGLLMGLAQWPFLRSAVSLHYLWAPASTIGFTAAIGSWLLLIAVFAGMIRGIPFQLLRSGSIFVPLTILAPFLIVAGPLSQWAILRSPLSLSPASAVFMTVAWIFAISTLFPALYYLDSILPSPTPAVLFISIVIATAPAGAIIGLPVAARIRHFRRVTPNQAA